MNIDEKYENSDTVLKKFFVAVCHPFNKFIIFWDFKEYFDSDRYQWGITKLFLFLKLEHNFPLIGKEPSPKFQVQ